MRSSGASRRWSQLWRRTRSRSSRSCWLCWPAAAGAAHWRDSASPGKPPLCRTSSEPCRRMRVSSISLRQQAYQALHDIVGGAYFSDRANVGHAGLSRPAQDLKAGLMSSLQDPIRDGLRRGWKVLGGPHGEVPPRIACDVAIIGSGAGAGITAELLAKAGLKVVIVEEGPLKSSRDFNQREADGLSFAVPGERGAQDRRQGHQHPAGPLRRRLHHRQLDQLVSHAGAHAGLLARAFRPGRFRQRCACALLRRRPNAGSTSGPG